VSWLACSVAILSAQAPLPPDFILHNARIYTVDSRNAVAEAVAIAGDRIVQVGRDVDILALKAPSTRVLDLRGATIVPGFHDAHGHVVGLGAALQDVDLRGTTSYEEIVGRIRRRLASARPGEWLIGRGWDQNDWAEKVFPTHDLLSAATPNNPVYLTRVDGHAGLANRQAMAAAGLTTATTDPPGGRIMRAADGQPSGVLIDGAQALVTLKIPPVSRQQLEIRSNWPIASFAAWASRWWTTPVPMG
jgi:predicted amidohydrolase YtcJ